MSKRRDKITTIIVVVTLCLGLILFSLWSMFVKQGPIEDAISHEDRDTQAASDPVDNPTTSIKNSDKITITNYADYVQNLSREEKLLIQQAIYYVVMDNNKGIQSMPSDVTIRNGSYKQAYDSATTIYKTSFLVDIASLKQSYRIEDIYSPLPREESGVSYSYSTLALCPDRSELIYGSFDCTDMSDE